MRRHKEGNSLAGSVLTHPDLTIDSIVQDKDLKGHSFVYSKSNFRYYLSINAKVLRKRKRAQRLLLKCIEEHYQLARHQDSDKRLNINYDGNSSDIFSIICNELSSETFQYCKIETDFKGFISSVDTYLLLLKSYFKFYLHIHDKKNNTLYDLATVFFIHPSDI